MPWIPRLLGIHLGVALLALAATGSFLTPAVELAGAAGTVLLLGEAALGVWLVTGVLLRPAATLVLALGPVLGLVSGPMALLECANLAAVAAFLVVLPPGADRHGAVALDVARTRQALVLLRVGVGVALIALAFTEKFTNPVMAVHTLEEFPALDVFGLVGIDVAPETFVVVAGAVELLFGLLVIWAPCRRSRSWSRRSRSTPRSCSSGRPSWSGTFRCTASSSPCWHTARTRTPTPWSAGFPGSKGARRRRQFPQPEPDGRPVLHNAAVKNPGVLSAAHDRWLEAEGDRLLAFSRASRHPAGGFAWLDVAGRPALDRPVELWITCRMTHVFSLGHLMGRPGCGPLADHGVAALTGRFRDARNGGWYAAVDADGADLAGRRPPTRTRSSSSPPPAPRAPGRPGAAELLDEALGGAAHPLLGRRARDGRRGVGRDVLDPRRLPGRQRQHAHGRGVPRRGGRHRGPHACWTGRCGS